MDARRAVWCGDYNNKKECATKDGKLSTCDSGSDCVFGGKQYGCVEKARVQCTDFVKNGPRDDWDDAGRNCGGEGEPRCGGR